MKHKIADDVNVNVSVDIPTEDLGDLIVSVVDGALILMGASVVAHLLKKHL